MMMTRKYFETKQLLGYPREPEPDSEVETTALTGPCFEKIHRDRFGMAVQVFLPLCDHEVEVLPCI